MHAGPSPRVSFVVPPPVRPGCIVRVIAPSGPFDTADFEAGVAFLRERYEVRYDEDIHSRDGFLAGSDERRLAELQRALGDREAVAIVAARGGYGAGRLLDRVSVYQVRSANKWLVGFSDITALHALWARAGLMSVHGPMVAWLGRAEALSRMTWIAALEGTHPPVADLEVLAGGTSARGTLMGGNLAVLAALLGTPHAPPLANAILFLEDVNEAPYRVDRMLTTMRQAGWLQRVAGILVGEFDSPSTDSSVMDVLRDRLGDLACPVLAGVPSGHGSHNRPLPFGAVTTLDPAARTALFEYPRGA